MRELFEVLANPNPITWIGLP